MSKLGVRVPDRLFPLSSLTWISSWRGAGIPAGKLSSLKESKSGKENLNSGISQFIAGGEDFNVRFMRGGIITIIPTREKI